MDSLDSLSERVIAFYKEKGLTIATAESCTGGLIAKLLTDIAGSSAVFSGSCVTYTNEVKERLLGVKPETIKAYTEVSFACAEEMAKGVKTAVGTDVGISTTGYAGPAGGTEKDPVGTVYIGWSYGGKTGSERFQARQGAGREDVRNASAKRVLEILLAIGKGEK